MEVSFISGGINLTKIEVYQKVGLQDEILFMYGDEIDFQLRVLKEGYKLVVIKEAQAWHKHIYLDKDKFRSELAYFLLGRNPFVLYKNYLSIFYRIIGGLKFLYSSLKILRELFISKNYKKLFYYITGISFGILGIQKIPRKILNNKSDIE
jgi:GT2 family glycosyltransferase